VLHRPGAEIVNHFNYGIVSDGDLMEGVSSEAASLAGHLKLGKLIYLYNDNRVTLSAGTDITFTEDRARPSRPMAGTSSRSRTATISLRSMQRCARPARNRSVPR
jgi:transketolase